MRSWWLSIVLGGLAACDQGTPLEPGTDVEVVSIATLVTDALAYDGEAVRIARAVVLGVDDFDEVGQGRVGTVYLSDSPAGPGRGLQAFAPAVRLPAGASLHPGDLVDVAGKFVRFTGPRCDTDPSLCFRDGRALPQLDYRATIDRVGLWVPPEPIELETAEYANNAASYVGALVTLRGLTVTATYELASGGTRLRAAETAEGVQIAADLYRAEGLEVGDHLDRLTGIASYFYSDFVMPRDADDVEIRGATP